MTDPLHHARAQLRQVETMLESDDSEWYWLVFWRLKSWIAVLEARDG